MSGKFELKENIVIERRRKDGTVIDREVLSNLIVNAGKEFVAKLLNGVSTNFFDYIAIGEGTTSAVVGDTTLETEQERELASLSYEASYKALFEKTFTFGSGVSYAITEAGVFDASSSGNMLDRFVFSAKNVDAETDLYVKVTITVA